VLSQEENELITRTGPGTPCGELMRRYWQPAALAEELPVGGPPLPVRLLGEDLVLFRDEQGRPGLLGLHCSHRGADLSYGRLEDGGLRCIYHGWLYDVNGRCLEQPGEPASRWTESGGRDSIESAALKAQSEVHSTFADKIRHPAYPCVERADVIFAYLGPGAPPEFPDYEFLRPRPAESMDVIKRYHECNYHQANEGNIDTSHLSFLHYLNMPYGGVGATKPGATLNHRGARPGLETMEVERTPYGVRGARVQGGWGDDKVYSVTEFILPNLGAFSNNNLVVGKDAPEREHPGYTVNWHVPIDDTHHWKYVFTFSSRGPLQGPRGRDQTEMVDYRPVRNLSNRFLQDREEMVNTTYLGLGADFQLHDKFVTESQGPIQDRSAEHLGALDSPVVMCRMIMLKAIHDLKEGREPLNVVRDPGRNQLPIIPLRAVAPLSMEWDWRQFRYGEDPELPLLPQRERVG
jgi:phthalate 4,5-dioxygenase oxygenase subunit